MIVAKSERLPAIASLTNKPVYMLHVFVPIEEGAVGNDGPLLGSVNPRMSLTVEVLAPEQLLPIADAIYAACDIPAPERAL